MMEIEILDDAAAVARRAAELLTEHARSALAARGKCFIALSGGKTPAAMFQAWAGHALDWSRVHVLQVDERIAPARSADRNLTQLEANLLAPRGADRPRLHAMPVESDDLEAAAEAYARGLQDFCGVRPLLDLVHLGLGADGHTASLFPGDPSAERSDIVVVTSAAHQGFRRMTLTQPVLDRARCVLWVVTGGDKAPMLRRLVEGDVTIPAGRIRQDRAILLADRAASAAMQDLGTENEP